jgi:hypothetical protein
MFVVDCPNSLKMNARQHTQISSQLHVYIKLDENIKLFCRVRPIQTHIVSIEKLTFEIPGPVVTTKRNTSSVISREFVLNSLHPDPRRA